MVRQKGCLVQSGLSETPSFRGWCLNWALKDEHNLGESGGRGMPSRGAMWTNWSIALGSYAWNRDGQAGAGGDGVRSGEAFLGKAFGLAPENSGDSTRKRVYTVGWHGQLWISDGVFRLQCKEKEQEQDWAGEKLWWWSQREILGYRVGVWAEVARGRGGEGHI